MTVHLLIPARLQSTRLPEKLLRKVAGKSILQYTYEAASGALETVRPIVAVDDSRLADEVEAFGGQWVLTDVACPSGTDRIAQAVDRLVAAGRLFHPHDVIVNVQGDEPRIEPAAIRRVVDLMQRNPDADMTTVATAIGDPSVFVDPSVVKIAMTWDAAAEQGRAMYFSRAPIPHDRDGDADFWSAEPPTAWHHIGLYAYRRDFLSWFAASEPSPLERREKLEQLRALEHGKTIWVGRIENAAPGIDTEDDLRRFEQFIDSGR